MNKPLALTCSVFALCLGLASGPAAQAAESGGSMSKMSGDAMMHKGSMKGHKKHKGSMMQGDAMKKDEAPPQQ